MRPSDSHHGIPAADAAGAGLALIALFAISAPALHAGETNLSAEIGIGYDANPFETPSDPYFDQYEISVDPNAMIVDPKKSPGFYVPFALSGDYLVPGEKHQFLLDYRLRHHAYGSGNGNADETYFRVAPAYQMVIGGSSGRDSLFFARPHATYSKEIYFDRDTGVGQVIGVEDASKRYTYVGTGAEAGFSSEIGRTTKWEVAGSYERRDYEDVESTSSLDQDRIEVGSKLSFRVSRRLRYYFDYTYRILDYDERPSRDPDGGITANGTPVLYSYHIVGNTLRFSPSGPWTLYFDLDYSGRDDRFEGYNDYHLFGGRVRALWDNGPYRVRAALRYRQRDYPHAFIFDKEVNPGTGRLNPSKDYDILDASLRFEAPLARDWGFFAETEMLAQDAADPRFTYDNLRIAAGVKWGFERETE